MTAAATWECVTSGTTTIYHRARMRSGGWLAVKYDDGAWRWGVYLGPGRKVATGSAATWQRARALAEAAAANLGSDASPPPPTVRISVELEPSTLEALAEYRASVGSDDPDDLLTDRVLDLALDLLDRLEQAADERGH
jgi:hypothetical protein